MLYYYDQDVASIDYYCYIADTCRSEVVELENENEMVEFDSMTVAIMSQYPALSVGCFEFTDDSTDQQCIYIETEVGWLFNTQLGVCMTPQERKESLEELLDTIVGIVPEKDPWWLTMDSNIYEDCATNTDLIEFLQTEYYLTYYGESTFYGRDYCNFPGVSDKTYDMIVSNNGQDRDTLFVETICPQYRMTASDHKGVLAKYTPNL